VLFSHWPIRNKLQLGLGLLAVSVLTLFGSAYYGLYGYRSLVKGLSARSTELPLADELSQCVADLRVSLSQVQERLVYGPTELVPQKSGTDENKWDTDDLRETYRTSFVLLRRTLDKYRRALDANRLRSDEAIGDDSQERLTLAEIDAVLVRIQEYDTGDDGVNWMLDGDGTVRRLRGEVENLRRLASKLPSHLHDRLHKLANEVHSQYRLAIVLAWITIGLATALLIAAVQLFRKWIARPLATLVEGSREVAAGKFDHRMHLESQDEMHELAEAFNDMTARFQEIRDDLDCQVRERTKQVVRSEQLASVGFLAAGVAHEINNPLASIAMCSESLESRLSKVLAELGDSHAAERDVIRSYLDMIQKEAFRCKQITEKLLDFSRMGDPERHNTDLRELVTGVIEMVCHLGKNQSKNVRLASGPPVIAEVCPQELKQVVLNLITNALDSLDTGGAVTISVASRGAEALIIVEDNGCGMTEEVIQHLFEPFFTRRRNGQGTGLGLSITYRIVEEHHGQITAQSAGPGKGSKFTVTLPLRQPVSRRQRPVAA
jgi:signal transduction histidine kinase